MNEVMEERKSKRNLMYPDLDENSLGCNTLFTQFTRTIIQGLKILFSQLV
jgi:hypothetical protein